LLKGWHLVDAKIIINMGDHDAINTREDP
jgi:hypothetical protein